MKNNMRTRLITIYLPQFHEIKENNEWWGQGFTEWTNVKRGRPFYPGHYQPRVPYQNNYYDLSNLEVLEAHTRLAQKAGIYGFGFYHYYFSGRKLLETPIEQYRDNSKETFPYCLIWANQSWARTWYRADAGMKILLKQEYGSKNEWIKHYNYLNTFFIDPRYIKIDNKPVYIIYLPQDIEARNEMFDVWNRMAIANGFSGIYLIAMNTGLGYDKANNLYNAYMNFEPLRAMRADTSVKSVLQMWKEKQTDKIKKTQTIKNFLYTQNAYVYNDLCKNIEKGYRVPSKTKTMFGAFAGWDNTSRKDEAGVIVRNSTPKRFGLHIKRMLELSEKNGNEFLFLNAWNEWSEGAYIEPDKRYEFKYLEELEEIMHEHNEK